MLGSGPAQAVSGWLLSWPGISLLAGTLLAFAVGVLSMSPAQYVLAQVCFSLSALLLSCRIAWWMGVEYSGGSSLHRATLAVVIFGAIGLLWVELLAWTHRLSVHLAPIVTIQLTPPVDETQPTETKVSGALIVFANNRDKPIANFDQLVLLPPIRGATVPAKYHNRLQIVSGNKAESTFLHFVVKNFKPGEHLFAQVEFWASQVFTSSDAWGRQFGYSGENVMVYRTFIGPEQSPRQ
jgi:hypothetical protein